MCMCTGLGATVLDGQGSRSQVSGQVHRARTQTVRDPGGLNPAQEAPPRPGRLTMGEFMWEHLGWGPWQGQEEAK